MSSTPLAVCLATASLTKLLTDTTPPTGKKPPRYGCFTTVAVHLDGSDWVVKNMPIHRWLLETVFTVAALDPTLTVANTKAYQLKPKAVGTPRTTQSSEAIVPIRLPQTGSKARQGKRIVFGLSSTSATALAAAIAAGTAPKSFGKSVVEGASVIMPSQCTNPQIGAWFSSHMPVARLGDIVGAEAFRTNGTAIGITDLSAPADFAKQFANLGGFTKARLQAKADAPVIAY